MEKSETPKKIGTKNGCRNAHARDTEKILSAPHNPFKNPFCNIFAIMYNNTIGKMHHADGNNNNWCMEFNKMQNAKDGNNVADVANGNTNTTKSNNTNGKIDIASLLAIANTTNAKRDANTCRIYGEKINFSIGSGIEKGKRYIAKIANNTAIVYADEKGNKASEKGDGVLLSIKAKWRKGCYNNAVIYGKKSDGNCIDYAVMHENYDGNDYAIIDLMQHAPKGSAKDGEK